MGKTQRMVGLAIFTAIIIVLQLVSTFIKFGPFSITLAMIPIVVGAAVYGAGAGAYLGGVFSVVVLICCVTGADPGGAVVWNANPFLCIVVCMVKGMAAGLAAGLVYRLIAPKSVLGGTVVAAVLSPIVNTGIFYLGLALFFRPVLLSWTGETDVLYNIIVGLLGVNFLVELGVNVVLSPIAVSYTHLIKPWESLRTAMTSRECWKQVTGITGWLKKFPAHSPPSLSGKPSIWARAGAAYALCAPNAPASPAGFPTGLWLPWRLTAWRCLSWRRPAA